MRDPISGPLINRFARRRSQGSETELFGLWRRRPRHRSLSVMETKDGARFRRLLRSSAPAPQAGAKLQAILSVSFITHAIPPSLAIVGPRPLGLPPGGPAESAAAWPAAGLFSRRGTSPGEPAEPHGPLSRKPCSRPRPPPFLAPLPIPAVCFAQPPPSPLPPRAPGGRPSATYGTCRPGSGPPGPCGPTPSGAASRAGARPPARLPLTTSSVRGVPSRPEWRRFEGGWLLGG